MPSFNIRSFGSWIASKCSDFTSHADAQFQYPLFRIVDCFILSRLWEADEQRVSISALSDRGLLPTVGLSTETPVLSFNIRSFGSWIASRLVTVIGCIKAAVSISALSDRGLLRLSGARNTVAKSSFNIRSFGSWIASSSSRRRGYRRVGVSISALSDRGLLRAAPSAAELLAYSFNIRSFGSWIASCPGRCQPCAQ